MRPQRNKKLLAAARDIAHAIRNERTVRVRKACDELVERWKNQTGTKPRAGVGAFRDAISASAIASSKRKSRTRNVSAGWRGAECAPSTAKKISLSAPRQSSRTARQHYFLWTLVDGKPGCARPTWPNCLTSTVPWKASRKSNAMDRSEFRAKMSKLKMTNYSRHLRQADKAAAMAGARSLASCWVDEEVAEGCSKSDSRSVGRNDCPGGFQP